MTVTAAEARVEYAGNGSTKIFSYPYQFFQSNDLDVWLFVDATGVGTQQIIGTDYTVTGVMNPTGGNITFAVAPPAGTTVIIINNPDIIQTLHYVNADDFPADSHEQGLDRLTKICQRLSDRIDRAVRAPDYAPEDQVPDADTLINLVNEAADHAADSANSAAASAASANAAQASQTAAAASATAAAGSATAAGSFATAAQNSANAAAASAAAANVAKIVWRGAWSAATAYVANDAVSRSGSSYISKTTNTNKDPPSNPADWDLLAAKGNDGAGGGGSGDMLRANNLSDVIDPVASLNNIGGAPKASPVFTGNPQAPTPTAGDNDTSIATTAFVTAANAGKADKTYVDSQDNVLAAAIALKADLASPTFTGDPKAPTPATADNDTSIATTGFVKAQGYAPLASPVFTGNPQGPTPTAGDNDTSLATTAFVTAALALAGVPAGMQCVALPNGGSHGSAAAGMIHVFVMKDGSVRVGGDNVYPLGTVGSGSASGAPLGQGNQKMAMHLAKRVAIPSGILGKPVKAIQFGGSVIVLTDQGDLCAWGDNSQGQLGVGDLTVRYSPVLVSATNIGPRSAGGASRAVVDLMHSAYVGGDGISYGTVWARCADNTLWAWGYNGSGQCADATAVAKQSPTQCLKNDGGGNVVVADCAKIFAGGGSAASVGYIDTSGKVRLAGALRAGSVGRNTATAGSNVFRPIFTTSDIAGSDLPLAYQCIEGWVGGFGDTICIRCADKCAYAWGYAGNGNIGIGNTTQQNNPKKVGGGTAVATTLNGTVERLFGCMVGGSAGGGFLIQLTDQSCYAWGASSWYETPVAPAGVNSTPKQCTGALAGNPANILQVVGGGYVNVRSGGSALLADGKIVSWGLNTLDGVSAAAAATVAPVLVAQPYTGGSLPTQIKYTSNSDTTYGNLALSVLYANGQVYGCGRSNDNSGFLHTGLPLGLANYENPAGAMFGYSGGAVGANYPVPTQWPTVLVGEWGPLMEIDFSGMMGEIAKTVDAVSHNLKDQPLVFALIVINLIFLGVLLWVVSSAASTSRDRFNAQDKFLHELSVKCLDRR